MLVFYAVTAGRTERHSGRNGPCLVAFVCVLIFLSVALILYSVYR